MRKEENYATLLNCHRALDARDWSHYAIHGRLDSPQKVGFSDASWLFSSGVSVNSPVGQAFGLLGLLALLGFCAGALGLIMHQAWWPAMTVAAAAISIVAIVPWVSAWPLSSAIGALLVDVAVLIALLPPWADRLIHAL